MVAPEIFQHPLANQVMAYQRMQDDLERDHFGRWVIIHQSEKVGEDYVSYAEAQEAALNMGLDVLACFIRQVGVNTAIFLSQGS